ncbi:tRNA-dihydrouridine(20a/20b) synthase [NAD(P)+]-like [Orchesella cincta]|uniref:tRNA-dihydrouridine synthase n=1 Tax=Orchesella cincta TaxID=48709 RepID=A0A1D2MRY0_ORCCI|nr:tRNA-dihydrouridine(20a/20b) synthase [NAD(P)+]-like [Orchesella cincta]
MSPPRKSTSVVELFEEKALVKMCAPMVRYTRLPFRMLVREYDTDVVFTPMILADSFVKSEQCRHHEFTTCLEDTPLLVQFAAKNATDFADAAELVYGNSDGVDLNCGCPQSWACREGIGACMLRTPEVVADVLRQTRNRIADPKFSISVKIRIFLDIRRTIDLVRQLEATGVDFITVHGRTMQERGQPVHLDYIKTVVDSVRIPVVANGDVDSLKKAYHTQEVTGAKGVMSARAMLENPAMYGGYEKTPLSCVKRWIEINENLNTHFTMFHRHLIHMCESHLTKSERRVFNNLTEKDDVLNYLADKFEDLDISTIERKHSSQLSPTPEGNIQN